MEIKPYTKDRIPDVLQFERDLRAEEDFDAQRFYRSLPNARIRDEGIWIDP